ncbi:MAG: hypothetical protein LCH96_00010 [Actinobacteria bacterium]|nr:hypothetical protein [Actinomycetota bacterium]
MSDDVNEYGLGAPGTQPGEPVTHEYVPDPLAHGLGGDREHDHGAEDVAEGGRHNRLEHGLAGAGFNDARLDPGATEPDPLGHGLGSPDAIRGEHNPA